MHTHNLYTYVHIYILFWLGFIYRRVSMWCLALCLYIPLWCLSPYWGTISYLCWYSIHVTHIVGCRVIFTRVPHVIPTVILYVIPTLHPCVLSISLVIICHAHTASRCHAHIVPICHAHIVPKCHAHLIARAVPYWMSLKLSGQLQPYSKPANFRRRIALPNLIYLNLTSQT